MTVHSLLSVIPQFLLKTLQALKSLPKLQTALEEFSLILDSSPTQLQRSEAYEILEKVARPILLDAGTGKKGATEILENWKNFQIGGSKTSTEDQPPQSSSKAIDSRKGPLEIKSKKEKIVVDAKDVKPGETKAAARRRLREEAASTSNPTSETSNEPLQTLPASLAAQLPPIFATSQESRFHADVIVTETKEIDLKDVTVSIDGKELISSAHLRIKEGVHYGLHARNGLGKSTMLRALSDRIIPGLPTNIKILLVSQVENDLSANQQDQQSESSNEPISVLQAVKESDKVRARAEKEFNALSKALDSQVLEQIRATTTRVLMDIAQDELDTARRISLRRSGARGADARKTLILAEKNFEEAKVNLLSRSKDEDWTAEATGLMAKAQAVLESLDSTTTDSRARAILHGLGFSDARMEAPYASLSGGWKSRTSLASALLQPTHVLLLDEADNYLDLPAVIWLQGYIQSLPHSVITISHDREFLDSVAEELIVLRKNTLAYFAGNLTEYERQQRKTYKHAIKQQEALDRKKEKVEKSIEDNLRAAKKSGDDNKLRMVKSRQTKLDERFGVEVSAKGTRFKLNRDTQGYFLTSRQGVQIDAPDRPMNFTFPDPEPLRFPGALVHLDDVSFTYKGSTKPTLQHVEFTLGEGERAAFIGPNGHGKTTLINLIMGNLSASSGVVERHPRAKVHLYAQHTIEMLTSPPSGWTESADTLGLRGDPTTGLGHFLEFTDQPGNGPPAKESEARQVLGQMGLGGRLSDTQKVWTLSGGQKVRLGLAKTLWGSPDLVVLDEVTTHLDGDSITALISALRRYTGAVLLCSHDRHAVKALVENKGKAGAANGAVDSDESSSEDEDEEKDTPKTGKVYLVQHSKVKILEGGMDQYSRNVEKEAERGT